MRGAGVDIGSLSKEAMDKRTLNIHEKPNGDTFLKGIAGINIASAKDIAEIIEVGNKVKS